MSAVKFMRVLSATLYFTIISAPIFAAGVSFTTLKRSGSQKIEFSKKLIKEIPDLQIQIETYQQLESRWEGLLAEYEASANKDKKNTLQSIQLLNLKLDDTIREGNMKLDDISKNLIKVFAIQLHKAEHPPSKEIYFNSYKVAKQEYERATKAVRSNQTMFAANLYKRSIQIMRSLNAKLGWETNSKNPADLTTGEKEIKTETSLKEDSPGRTDDKKL